MASLRLGDTAPDFTQHSSAGDIHFHQWLGDSWGVLFSHPVDFIPVCTTELGLTAKLKEEFAKRNVKAIALSPTRPAPAATSTRSCAQSTRCS
jgi:thioredoxin-dependent peroxiredoxin